MKLGQSQLQKIKDLRIALESTPWIGALIEDALINKLYNAVCAMERNETKDGKHYDEPVKVPTDEDAKKRPWVMVRDADTDAWVLRSLIYAANKSRFVCITEYGGSTSCWKQCRFPTDEERRKHGI